METLKSGDLARRAGVNPETLRYYEREGLLPEPLRSESGYRLYSVADVKRVQFIRRSQELGFSLKEIRELLALKMDASQPASTVKQLTEQKILVIEEKIQSLQAMKQELLSLVKTCSGEGSVDHCPILKNLDETKTDKPVHS